MLMFYVLNNCQQKILSLLLLVGKTVGSPAISRHKLGAATCLPNAQMLNIWLNIKNNCSMKKIKNRGMSCNILYIPEFAV